jgi:hypothetical protein
MKVTRPTDMHTCADIPVGSNDISRGKLISPSPLAQPFDVNLPVDPIEVSIANIAIDDPVDAPAPLDN